MLRSNMNRRPALAIQLLLARGCHVISRTSPARVDLVEASGVAAVPVRGHDELGALDEVDAVVDVAGGAEFGQLIDRVRDGGRLVIGGAVSGTWRRSPRAARCSHWSELPMR